MLITKRRLTKDVLVLLVEKYNSTVDLIGKIMRDLHTSFFCGCHNSKDT
jgi:hypothetical protein